MLADSGDDEGGTWLKNAVRRPELAADAGPALVAVKVPLCPLLKAWFQSDDWTDHQPAALALATSSDPACAPDLVKLLLQKSATSGSESSTGNQTDLQDRVEKSSVITLADLKPGDAIIVSSIAGADPSRITAVVLAAGVEELVKRQTQQPSRPLNLGLGLPSGSLP